MFSTSRNLASTGRICLLFAAAGAGLTWLGARPAEVLAASMAPDTDSGPGAQTLEVNVKVSGVRDTELLAKLRARPEGNTFANVPLFDPLTDEQRAEAAATYPVWAEWMPYQAGQASKTDEANKLNATEIAELKLAVESVTETLSGLAERIDKLETFASGVPGRFSSMDSTLSGVNGALTTTRSVVESVRSQVDHLSQMVTKPQPGTLGETLASAFGLQKAEVAVRTLANHISNDGSEIEAIIGRIFDSKHGEPLSVVKGSTCCLPVAAPDHDGPFATNPQDAPKVPAKPAEEKPAATAAADTQSSS